MTEIFGYLRKKPDSSHFLEGQAFLFLVITYVY